MTPPKPYRTWKRRRRRDKLLSCFEKQAMGAWLAAVERDDRTDPYERRALSAMADRQ